MSLSNTVVIGLLLMLAAITIAIFLGGALILLASRIVLGRSGMIGSAAMAVVASAVVNVALAWGLLMLAAKAPGVVDFTLALQGARIVLGVLLTCVVYMLLLDPKPNFVQAFLILVIQSVIGGAIAFAAVFLAVSVFHVSLPQIPALP